MKKLRSTPNFRCYAMMRRLHDIKNPKKFLLCGFEGAKHSQVRESVYGGDTAMDTPVPIPNTAVKHREVEGTWRETAREIR